MRYSVLAVCLSILSGAACRSTSGSEVKDLSIIGEDGKPVQIVEDEILTVDIFTGPVNPNKKIIFRGESGAYGSFYVVDAQKKETPIKAQFIYGDKAGPELHLFAGPNVDSFTGIEVVGSTALQLNLPLVSEKGEIYKHFYVTKNIGAAPNKEPIKLCHQNKECDVAINMQANPPSIVIKHAASLLKINGEFFNTATDIGLHIHGSPVTAKVTSEIPNLMIGHVAPGVAEIKDYDYLVAINDTNFVTKGGTKSADTLLALDKALDAKIMDVKYLSNDKGKVLSGAELQEAMTANKVKTMRFRRE